MTPEDAYNEWLLLFGFREVSYDEIVSKELLTTGQFLYNKNYIKKYPETKSAHYRIKQPHEIKENNEPTT